MAQLIKCIEANAIESKLLKKNENTSTKFIHDFESTKSDAGK